MLQKGKDLISALYEPDRELTKTIYSASRLVGAEMSSMLGACSSPKGKEKISVFLYNS